MDINSGGHGWTWYLYGNKWCKWWCISHVIQRYVFHQHQQKKGRHLPHYSARWTTFNVKSMFHLIIQHHLKVDQTSHCMLPPFFFKTVATEKQHRHKWRLVFTFNVSFLPSSMKNVTFSFLHLAWMSWKWYPAATVRIFHHLTPPLRSPGSLNFLSPWKIAVFWGCFWWGILDPTREVRHVLGGQKFVRVMILKLKDVAKREDLHETS